MLLRTASQLAALNRSAAAAQRFSAGAAGSQAGQLVAFEGIAYTGAPMYPGGWQGRIIVSLDGVVVPRQHRPVLRQHDHEQIAGHTTRVRVDSDGIKVKGAFSGQPQHAAKVIVPARNGFPWQMSIGATPAETEFVKAGERAKVNGRTVTGPITISWATILDEVSFVPLGADQNTSAVVFAGAGFQQTRTPKPAQARTARPAPVAAMQPRESFWGVASYYGRYATSSGANAARHPRLIGGDGNIRYQMLPGAFGPSILAADAGTHEIKLLANHDRRAVLASTADDSLHVWSGKSSLRFAINPDTERGRGARRFLKRNPDLREASIGGHFEPSHMNPITKGFSLCGLFDLEEISIVRHGGCPDTWVEPCVFND